MLNLNSVMIGTKQLTTLATLYRPAATVKRQFQPLSVVSVAADAEGVGRQRRL
jgi:hypothetical protein